MEYKNLDVFVLTYNRAKYLKIMLDSLCTQTAKGFNIKVLNNASTDNTIEIVNQIQQEYPERNITIITNEKNIGNVGNFKHSQELATNEYTAIFHDDDAIHPEYIETAMKIFEKNSDIVMCSGNHIALWNVDNNDWHLLYKNYYKYKQKDAAYLNLLVNRPTFAANIYKTAAYKKIMYHPELYGKLHDVIFMIEMNKIGSTAFILGACIKWRQSIVSDSSNLKTGPFPNEIANIVHKIKKLNSNHKLLGAPLLYNFAYFLYKWSALKRFLTWKEFEKELINNGSFTNFEIFIFRCIPLINYFNKLIIQRAEFYRRKITNEYESRF